MHKLVGVLISCVVLLPGKVRAEDLSGAVRYAVDSDRVTKHIRSGIYGQFLEHICNSIHGGLWGDQILNGTIEPPLGDNPWIIADGAVTSKKPLSDRLLLVGDDRWADYELTLQACKVAGEEGFWLVTRATDAQHCWRINLGGWGNKEHGTQKHRGGGWGAHVPGTIETGRWYKIRVRCEGPRCQVWLDDVMILDRTDTREPQLRGCVGLNAYKTQVQYKDIQITGLDGKVLFQGLPSTVLPPPYWRLLGTPDIRYETPDAYNSHTRVRLVRTNDAPSGIQGLQQKPIAVRQGRTYTITSYIKAAAPARFRFELVDPTDQVVWSKDVTDIGAAWQKTVLTCTPPRTVDDATLRIGLTGPGDVSFDQISMFSDEALANGGYRPDLLKAVADLKPASIRWPGGCFASQYIWKSGIGPRDKRLIHTGEIWEDRDTNQYGTDEFMRMCEIVGAEPILVLNTHAGVSNAMEWLEYCMGDETTPWGKVRAANGHPKPYHLPVLEIDNEAWNMGQKGYAAVVEKFSPEIRAKYPQVLVSACGGYGYEEEEHGERKNWNKGLIALASKSFDFISPHYYNGMGPALDYKNDPRRYEASMALLGEVIRASENPAMKVYVSEWNPMTTDWRTGLYAGGILNGFERQADVVTMSCPALWLRRTWAQSWDNALINHDHRTWFPAPNYVVMKLWREHFAPDLLALEGPERPLNLTATRAADGSRIFLKIVNPEKNAVTARFEMKGSFVSGRASMLIVAPGAENARNTLDCPNNIQAVPHDIQRDGGALVITMPPLSAGAVTIAK